MLERDVVLDGEGGHSETAIGDIPEAVVIEGKFTDPTAGIVGLDLLVDERTAGWRIELAS
jgi:hypothetical protein